MFVGDFLGRPQPTSELGGDSSLQWSHTFVTALERGSRAGITAEERRIWTVHTLEPGQASPCSRPRLLGAAAPLRGPYGRVARFAAPDLQPGFPGQLLLLVCVWKGVGELGGQLPRAGRRGVGDLLFERPSGHPDRGSTRLPLLLTSGSLPVPPRPCLQIPIPQASGFMLRNC